MIKPSHLAWLGKWRNFCCTSNRHVRRVHLGVRLFREVVAAGAHVKDLNIAGEVTGKHIGIEVFLFVGTAQFYFRHQNSGIDFFLDMATMMGSDVTKNQLEWQFRRYRAGAKLQQAAVAAGTDPKDANVDVNPKGGASGGQILLLFIFISISINTQTTKQLLIFQIYPSTLERILRLGESNSSFAL